MARTRQTARLSTGGKAPRKSDSGRGKGGKGLGVGGAKRSISIHHPSPASVPYSYAYSSSSSSSVSQNIVDDDDDESEITETPVNYDVTYETSFYAHYFETGQEDKKVFQPRYSVLKLQPNEATSQPEYWMGVNFNSKFDGEGLKKHGRPDLCLVIALDISGSMGATFEGDNSGYSKMKISKEAVKAIVSQLQDNDVLGIILFDDHPTVFMPLTKCSNIDKIKLEKDINRWRTGGGTALAKAYETSCQMLSKAQEGSNNSKRVFFFTDMEACSKQDGDNLVAVVNSGSSESVWTTVVGIGEDLTSSIIERISKIPGSNYSNVRSADGFKQLMDQEFGFLVTPLGFNIEMDLTSKDAFVIEKGFGSPEVRDLSEGQIVKFSTEFPSHKNEKGEKRGAIILFKLRPVVNEDGSSSLPLERFSVKVQHEDLKGMIQVDEQQLEFTDQQNPSVRKAVLLVKYTDFVRGYLSFRENRVNGATSPSENYYERITAFRKFFESEMALMDDASLASEMDILTKLLSLEPVPSDSLLPAAPPSTPATTTADNNNKENLEDVVDDQPSKKQRVEPSNPISMDVVPPSEADDDNCCVICLSSKKDTLILPCKHLCLCSGCANSKENELKDCPLCRIPIEQKVSVFT